MPFSQNTNVRPRILIVGGGYLGFITAKKLLAGLNQGEGSVMVVDPNPYMTYQPFLPEVAAGSIEARHALVPLRRHLKGADIITGKVTSIDHANRTVNVDPELGDDFTLEYDHIVMAAGSVPRALPIPGLAEEGIGFKTIEEAVTLRDHVLARLDEAAVLTDPEERKRALTFVFVGGGFAGIEAIAEIQDMVKDAIKHYTRLSPEDPRFVLVEAMSRVMPEVSEEQAKWVVASLRERGVDVYLDTQLKSCENKHIVLSTGEEFDADTIVWNAGVKANPVLVDSDLPIDDRGRLMVGTDLRVRDDDGNVVEGAWGAGDNAAVPDVTGMGPGGFCVPNAQHALRHAPVLASNILTVIRGGGELKQYKHKTIGSVAGLGVGKGVAQVGKFGLRGLPAWMMHRGYHAYAMPTFERKARILGNWAVGLMFGRDASALMDLESPRHAFVDAANSKPAPKKEPKGEPAKS